MTVRLIDTVWTAATPEILPYRPARSQRQLWGDGHTGDYLVQQMDEHGIEAAVVAATCGERPERWAVPHDVLKQLIDAHPGRFVGLAGFNVFEGAKALRAAVRAIDQLGFKGLHVHPHWLDLPSNSPQIDPFYALAQELAVPVAMVCGVTLKPHNVSAYDLIQASQRLDLATLKPYLSRFTHPAYLDDVCRRFPEVKIVALNIGWPWTDDLVDLSAEHPNLYICPSKFYPSTWNPSLIEFMRGPGAGKILWGSDYPQLELGRAIQELHDLALSPEVYERVVRQNAIEVFRLDE